MGGIQTVMRHRFHGVVHNAKANTIGPFSQHTYHLCCVTLQRLGNLYGDRFSTAWNNLVSHGMMRRSISKISGNPQRLQLLWQEWHFRAAFEGHKLMQQLYTVYTVWMNLK